MDTSTLKDSGQCIIVGLADTLELVGALSVVDGSKVPQSTCSLEVMGIISPPPPSLASSSAAVLLLRSP